MKQAFRFYLLACFLSWTIALPLVIPHFGYTLFATSPYHHALVGLGPCIAAFLIKASIDGWSGVRQLFQRCLRFNKRWPLLVALFAPFILLLLAAAIDYVRGGKAPDLLLAGSTGEFPQFNFATYFFYNLLSFGFGEEVGWKGIMLPAFQKRWSALTASIVFTAFWALWHLPLFFYRTGYVEMKIGGTVGWLFSLLTGSILLTWLFNSSKGSILVCAVFHATIDMAFVNKLATGAIVSYLGFLITVWGLVTIFVFGPKHLSKEKKLTTAEGL